VKRNLMLTITSLLSILFMTLHLTSDTVHARVAHDCGRMMDIRR